MTQAPPIPHQLTVAFRKAYRDWLRQLFTEAKANGRAPSPDDNPERLFALFVGEVRRNLIGPPIVGVRKNILRS